MSVIEQELQQPASGATSGERTGSAMRISCRQAYFSRGLAIVSRAVGGRTTLPVLNNVLLSSDGERLRLSATNLEIGITTWIPAQVEAEGQLTVPARLLTDFVNSLPSNGNVSLDVNQQTFSLHVESSRFRANIKGIDPEEFPPLPAADDRPTVRLRARLLKEMIAQVAFSAARDESRPVLTGVNLKVDESMLTMAAADGFRLSLREAALERGLPERLDIIIPARSLQELARLLGDDDEEDVELTVTPNRTQILFRLRTVLTGSESRRGEAAGEAGAEPAAPATSSGTSVDVVLVSRLLEGQFPDLLRVIPKTHTTRAVLKRGEFITATRIASLFARDAANVVRLEITPGADGGLTPGTVAISANAAEVGDNRGELDGSVEGEETYISFSSEYLGDVLGVLGSDEIALEVTGPLSPAVVRGLGLAEYTHVIMPMHTVK